MATTNRRDVSLGVSIETSGEADLTGLGKRLRDLGLNAEQSSPELERLAAELDTLAAATARNRAAENAARADAAAARTALDQQRDALARLRAESTTATRGTEEFAAAERAARLAIIDARAALRDKAAAVQASVADSRASVAAERQAADALRALAAEYRAAATAATTGGTQQRAANEAVARSIEQVRGQLGTLRDLALAATGGTLVGSLARDVAETADAFANLRARIGLVTGEGAALSSAFDGVLGVAQRTNATLEATGTLFARILAAGRDMNVSTAEALRLTETINQAVAVSGASAQSSEAAITQLIQGLQSGVLRGEEFNSVMEQAPRLAQALADGLGVARGELRKLAEQGSLTSATVIDALRGQAQTITTEYERLPPTVGRALTGLSNAWTVYIGETDKATGASATAAAAIQSLAANLNTLGAVLFSAGKAVLAYQALKVATGFLEAASATAAATAATTANTAATVTNTAAVAANAAARQGSAAAIAAEGAAVGASAGRFAALLGTLKTFTFVGVVTNLREIGTAIGEGAARLLGYGKALEESERAARADEQAARANAAAKAELAQRTRQAADAALGLTDEARKLVGQFDGLRQKGDSVAEALGKVSKELRLSDLDGIRTAGAALDALGERGQITATQIREALRSGLSTADLGVFETQARAVFDSSAQGARRLAAAIDAIGDEALRRAGTSARELETGFSAATASAINDVDALGATLDRLGVKGTDASRALVEALTRATSTAGTERAVQAVIERWEALGRAGRITGDALVEGLERARRKLDELAPGVSSLDEALRAFGLRTRAEITATAEQLGRAWERIANDTRVSLSERIEAFGRFRDAAVAANNGVEPSQVQLQRRILETQAAAAGLGETFARSMRGAADATNAAADAQARYNRLLREDPSRLVGGNGLAGIRGTAGNPSSLGGSDDAARAARLAGNTGAVDNSYIFQLRDRLNRGEYFAASERPAIENALRAAKDNAMYAAQGARGVGFASTVPSLNNDADVWVQVLTRVLERTGSGASSGGTINRYPVTVNIAGRRPSTINVESAADQAALTGLLQDLETAAGRS